MKRNTSKSSIKKVKTFQTGGNQTSSNRNSQVSRNQTHSKLTSIATKSKLNLNPKIQVQPSQKQLKYDSMLRSQLLQKNKQLVSQNRNLKDQFCRIQQQSTADKEKIRVLIARVSQLKRPQSQPKATAQQGICGNRGCQQKRRCVQIQLYKERIKRNQLENDKKQWQRNKQQLRNQYKQLLEQIKAIKHQ